MHVIALISQKGGSGKTTLAVALAVAHEVESGTSTVVDLDPQGSAVAWHHLRSGAPPAVQAVHPPRLARALQTFQDGGVGLVVIDTAHHASAGALAASRLADLVLVPCRPSTPDLAAIGASLEVAGCSVYFDGPKPRPLSSRTHPSCLPTPLPGAWPRRSKQGAVA